MEQFVVSSLVVLWLVVICNLLLTLALIRRVNARGTLRPTEGLKEGEIAPDFTAEALNGEQVTLATYAHCEVAFVFISPHCHPCREALLQYEALAPKATKFGVNIILVSRGNVEQTLALVREFGHKLPVLVAPEGSNSFMEDYKLFSTPSYCLLSKQGKILSCGYPHLQEGIWKRFCEPGSVRIPA